MQFIQDSNMGGRLGAALSTGLQSLADIKLNQLQNQYAQAQRQYQQQGFMKELQGAGYSPEEASLGARLIGQDPKAAMSILQMLAGGGDQQGMQQQMVMPQEGMQQQPQLSEDAQQVLGMLPKGVYRDLAKKIAQQQMPQQQAPQQQMAPTQQQAVPQNLKQRLAQRAMAEKPLTAAQQKLHSDVRAKMVDLDSQLELIAKLKKPLMKGKKRPGYGAAASLAYAYAPSLLASPSTRTWGSDADDLYQMRVGELGSKGTDFARKKLEASKPSLRFSPEVNLRKLNHLEKEVRAKQKALQESYPTVFSGSQVRSDQVKPGANYSPGDSFGTVVRGYSAAENPGKILKGSKGMKLVSDGVNWIMGS